MGQGWGRNEYNGKQAYRDDLTAAVRSKWIWTPAEGTKLTTILDYSKQRNSMIAENLAPGTIYPAYFGITNVTWSGFNINQNEQPFFKNQDGGISIKLDQDLASLHLANILAYRRSTNEADFDLDYSPVPFQDVYLSSKLNQFSEEFQLGSAADSTIRWTSGLFYYHTSGSYDPSRVVFGVPGVVPFTTLDVVSTQMANSLAGYGQVTFPILPRTNVTLGARYTWEQHQFTGTEPTYLADGSLFANLATADAVATFKKPSYRASIDYHVNNDSMVYATLSTGFKSGGFNTQAPGDPAFSLGGEGVQREQPEGRRAIDEDVIEVVARGREQGAQPLFAAAERHQFDLGAGQMAIGRNQLHAIDGGGEHERAGVGRRVERGQRGVDGARRCGVALPADAAGEISLRIDVDEEDAPLGDGERCGQVDDRRGFTDAAFLVGNGNDAGHYLAVDLKK